MPIDVRIRSVYVRLLVVFRPELVDILHILLGIGQPYFLITGQSIILVHVIHL